MRILAMVRTLAAIALIILCGGIDPAQAQAPEPFPRQAIRIIVPFAAGGAPDIVARLIAQYASEGLGRQVVVENITGARSE